MFFTTGPHLITPVHVGGKLVKGFFKNIRKKIKKSPQLKKNVLFRGCAREIIHFTFFSTLELELLQKRVT